MRLASKWMLKCFLTMGICFWAGVFSPAKAQDQEIQQLLLNLEKLSQLKSILSDMEKGYAILSTGYNSVKNIAQGNFSLHEVFLDGLWLVSPEVRKYGRIADIIANQVTIVSEYKRAFARFSAGGSFQAGDLDYIGKVYSQLLKASLANLDQLALVVTDRQLRMNDAERLQQIDRIHRDTEDQLVFLRAFNREAGVLDLQRSRERSETARVRALYERN